MKPSVSVIAWLDVNGAAARVLVSPATIVREARSGRLVGYKVGGRKCWRFRPEDVDAWLMRSPMPVRIPHGLT
jgi:excisionase family DNA binding protein